MKDDYMSLPPCAERSIVCLIYKTLFYLENNSDEKPDLSQLFTLLKGQLREEELLTDTVLNQVSEGERLYQAGDCLDSAKKLECVRD
jgi:hypothetical protein